MKNSIIFGIVFLLMIGFASAITISDECDDVNAYEYGQITACQMDTYLMGANEVMSKTNDLMVDQIVESTVGGFSISGASDLLKFFQIIFSAFFLLIVSLTGYKFMVSAAYPEARAEAKRQLKNILVIAVFAVALPWLISELLFISNSMNDAVNIKIIEPEYFKLDSYISTSDSLHRFSDLYSTSPLFVTAAKSYLVSMYSREVILLFLVAISPIILLLFYYLPTQEYGKIALYLFMVELFAPVLYVLVFEFASIAVPTGETSKMFVLTAALFFNVLLHVLLILVSMLKAVLSVIKDIRVVKEK